MESFKRSAVEFMKYTPKDIDGVSAAFPTSVDGFLPKYSEVPDEFKQEHTKWNKLVESWFFNGLPKETEFIAKDGIDAKKAIRHCAYCLRSWEPKHEHKTAGVAYLLSLWFEDIRVPEKAKP